ncbi:MAG: methionine ABC transporter ATP-binding protein [Gammaproteobacteria bacterium HGW-Gammaproteobacteria-8]|nr:MAG: methionine ABC transporter ATP-binding protein [Gammaproteobacteria bacterium HGW-Gammaproteobacteria-8]
MSATADQSTDRSSRTPALEIVDLSHAWPDVTDPVLHGLSLTIDAGEHVFLAGPSGSGKSTLLSLIGGLIQAEHGSLRIAGCELAPLSRTARDRFRADHVGVIFQQFNLLPWLDAVANVRLGCHFSAQRRGRAIELDGSLDAAAARLLDAMQLPRQRWSQRAGALSVGEQQRVAAARALIGGPTLLLADEPSSALDSDRRDAFLELLFAEAGRAGAAILFVSHDRALQGRFDRALELTAIQQPPRQPERAA